MEIGQSLNPSSPHQDQTQSSKQAVFISSITSLHDQAAHQSVSPRHTTATITLHEGPAQDTCLTKITPNLSLSESTGTTIKCHDGDLKAVSQDQVPYLGSIFFDAQCHSKEKCLPVEYDVSRFLSKAEARTLLTSQGQFEKLITQDSVMTYLKFSGFSGHERLEAVCQSWLMAFALKLSEGPRAEVYNPNPVALLQSLITEVPKDQWIAPEKPLFHDDDKGLLQTLLFLACHSKYQDTRRTESFVNRLYQKVIHTNNIHRALTFDPFVHRSNLLEVATHALTMNQGYPMAIEFLENKTENDDALRQYFSNQILFLSKTAMQYSNIPTLKAWINFSIKVLGNQNIYHLLLKNFSACIQQEKQTNSHRKLFSHDEECFERFQLLRQHHFPIHAINVCSTPSTNFIFLEGYEKTAQLLLSDPELLNHFSQIPQASNGTDSLPSRSNSIFYCLGYRGHTNMIDKIINQMPKSSRAWHLNAALYGATKAYHLEASEYLYQQGATAQFGLPYNILKMSAVSGKFSLIKHLVADYRQGQEHELTSALIACAHFKSVSKEDVHNYNNYTQHLHKALILLLENGARKNYRTNNHKTSYQIAKDNPIFPSDLLELLNPKPSKKNALRFFPLLRRGNTIE